MLELRFDIVDSLQDSLTLQLAPFFKGERGLPGASNFLITAANAVGGNRFVYLDGDQVVYANNQNLEHGMKIVGVTTNAANVGDTLNISFFGEIEEPTWNWDMGKPIFLGVNGLPTQVVPTHPSAAFSLIVGFPISPTKMFVSKREPITLGA